MISTKQETTSEKRHRATWTSRWWSGLGILCLILATTAITAPSQDEQPSGDKPATSITFDAPGAGYGTIPLDINPAGAITGYYLDANNLFHGFLRARDGSYIVIDAPGAGTGAFEGTFAYSINSGGPSRGGTRTKPM